MLISYNQLKQLIHFDIPPLELADKLTMQGMEVEEINQYGGTFDHVVVGKIEKLEQHPNADKLTLCTVNNGNEELKIICGAKNHKEGDHVCVAMIGAELPGGFKIKKAKLRGVESFGMLCSKSELGLEEQSDGIWILDKDLTPGQSINSLLPEPDTIYNIALTANRGDCLSHMGIAKEIAAMVKSKVNYPKADFKVNNKIELPEVEIEDSELCYRYTSRIIKGVKVAESPDWLKEALIKMDSRPINNVVDITNYVLFELGHPLHAFDLNKLSSPKVIARKAKKGENLVSLDGEERKLDDSNLVIADEKVPVAIAGVMGGLDSSVTDKTTDLLLESAYFLPDTVRKTSKKLDLSSESSHRFERTADINGLIRSLDRCSQLIVELCGGEVSDLVDVYPNKKEAAQVDLRVSFTNERLGTHITKSEIISYLEPLEFEITDKDEDTLSLTVPTSKGDVEREIDVVEEIARIFGYNNIPETLPSTNLNPDFTDTHSTVEEQIKFTLNGFGLQETISYSFTNEKDFDKLLLKNENLIKIKNPVSTDSSSLRNNLFHSSVQSILHNVNHGSKSLANYEIGNIFTNTKKGFKESRKLSISLYGFIHEKSLYTEEQPYDFYYLKGIVEALINKLFGINLKYEACDIDYLHPARTAKLIYKKKEIGYLGEVHPQIIEKLKLAYPLFYSEIDLTAFSEFESGLTRYQAISKYPVVHRDLAILVDDSLESQQVLDGITKASKWINKIELVDVYRGEHIPTGKKSLAFSLAFQDPEKTLSDDIVNGDFDKIVNHLKKHCGGEMREA